MAINSKAKGNKFERDISEQLSLWLTDQKEKRACWRSDSSGATATNWAKKGLESRYVAANAGDIRKIIEKGEYANLDNFFETFVVEVKHYKAVEFYPPVSGTLEKFFQQALAEKKQTGKRIVLIIKANNKKILYCQEGVKCFDSLEPEMIIPYQGIMFSIFKFEDVVKTSYVNNTSGTSGTVGNEPRDNGL